QVSGEEITGVGHNAKEEDSSVENSDTSEFDSGCRSAYQGLSVVSVVVAAFTAALISVV
ncbi:hypothetical protein J3B02_004608, partial [Coemansia erecta]